MGVASRLVGGGLPESAVKASGSGYQELLGAAWEWIKRDADTWVRTLGDLRAVLTEYGLESEDTLKFALRFSAFSILIAMLVDYPAKTLLLGETFSITISRPIFILYYVVTFAVSVALKIMSVIVVARRSMRVCFVMSLFATVYWPLQNLTDYISFSDRTLYTSILDLKLVGPGMTTPSIMVALIAVTVAAFMFIKLVSATRYVFRVSLVRSSIMVSGVSVILSVIQVFPMRPIFDALLKREFGS